MDPCSLTVLLSGLSAHQKEPVVLMHRLVVHKSFFAHLCRSAPSLFGLFHPHLSAHVQLCLVANCFCGLAHPSLRQCRQQLGCGAPGSIFSSLVSSGCILVSTLSRTVQLGIEPSSISVGCTSPVKQTFLGAVQTDESFGSAMLMVLTGEACLCRTVWL